MGTMLQARGLEAGARPESMLFTDPAAVGAVHKSYVEAGSRVVYTDTFGANAMKLAGSGYTVEAVVARAVAVAREACRGTGARVALDIGPIGQMMKPLGALSFEKAYEIFREIAVAGAASGADLIVLETLSDLQEVRAALLATKENTSLPVWATMTFDKGGRTFTGCTVPAMAMTLTGLGANAIGVNCSLGPKDMLPLFKELVQWTRLPLIVKANAGLPDPQTGAYSVTPEAFAHDMLPLLDLGVSIFGGCCGTNPDFIRAVGAVLAGKAPGKRPSTVKTGLCSASASLEIKGARVAGERINPTGKKRFQQALRENDMNYILARAVEQAEEGADILDVNVGLPGIDEAATMKEVVEAVGGAVNLPLMIDASDPKAVEAGLRAFCGRGVVNSVNGTPESLAAILPLCKKYGAMVVGLTVDESGVPQTAQERMEIAGRIVDAARGAGLSKEDVLVDCLTLTVSAEQRQARETLQAVRLVKEKLGVKTILGVSNCSFGLPCRDELSRSFLTQALAAGLDAAILNPNSRAMMDAVFAYRVFSGEDAGAKAYIARFSDVQPALAPTGTGSRDLTSAVLLGLAQEAGDAVSALLLEKAPLEVVNGDLIPALDKVGALYEKGEIFLPQLLASANAASAGFEKVRARLLEKGEAISGEKIVVATVQDDVHDIGKNIVKTVLQNYGYRVIDLGKDVPPSTVVEAVTREGARLVGLSALMTTTLSGMEKTIRALRACPQPVTIWVGGAVLTPEYALKIGADYYAKDARESVEIAKKVLGGVPR